MVANLAALGEFQDQKVPSFYKWAHLASFTFIVIFSYGTNIEKILVASWDRIQIFRVESIDADH